MPNESKSVALIGMVIVFVLSGCTLAAGDTETEAAVPDFVMIVEPEWTVAADLIGDPTYQDGYVASYVAAADGALNVVVWDATTGVEAWRDSAEVGATTPGVEVTLSSLQSGGKSFVSYLRPYEGDDTGWQRIVVAEIGTGIQVDFENDHVWATARPEFCADGNDMCFTGWLDNAWEAEIASFRVDSKAGNVVRDTDVVIPGKSRLLGDRVFSTNGRAPDGTEELGYSANGEILWQIPYDEIFKKGYSSDGGWNWSLYDTEDVIVGWATYFDRARFTETKSVTDLTQTMVVGLDPTTGDVLWSLDEVRSCAASVIDPNLIHSIIPLCRFNSGTNTVVKSADGLDFDATPADVDIDLVGIDALSGDIVWEKPLGSGQSNWFSEEGTFATKSAIRPVNVNEKVKLVDVLTGDTFAMPKDGIFVCEIGRDPFETMHIGFEEIKPFNAGADATPCLSDLKATGNASFSAAGVRMAGTATGKNAFVIGSATGLSSYALKD